MVRLVSLVSLVVLVSCADKSRGAALNECRLRHYLGDAAAQAKQIPDCMMARSFQADAACNPEVDVHEWDWQVKTFAFNNPQCYRPVGSTARVATLMSPM
jgi:hypothetical protein